MANGRIEEFDDPRPYDKPVCSKFGSGAFPCGAPYKVQVATVTMVGRSEQQRRRVMCRAHYEFFISNVQGGAGGLKQRALKAAYEHLAASHLDEFQQLYEREIARCVEAEIPVLDPALILPTDQEN